MAAFIFYLPLPGTPTGVGYQLSFTEAGTSTPVNVWTDSDLTVAWAQPIVFNAAGEPDGPIYLSPTPALKVFLTDAGGVSVAGYPIDAYSPAELGS